MRIWLALGLAAVLGIVVGVGTAWLRVDFWSPWNGTPEGWGTQTPKSASSQSLSAQPKVRVEEKTHDFGVIESNTPVRHEFVFTNVGEGPLTLKEGSSSCQCTVAVAEVGEIAPGESGNVAVEWTGKRESWVGPFSQTAVILTNDPTQPQVRLTVKGRVTVAVRAVPSGVRFSAVTAGESDSAELRLFGYRSKFRAAPLEITGYELPQPEGEGGSSAVADHLEVGFKPLPSDEVKEEKDATSGVLVEVTVKPGLPLGSFAQKILLKTNSEEAPTIEIPVYGKIKGEISIVGKGWDPERGVLSLGRVRSGDGAQRTVVICAGGSHHKDVRPELIEKVPDLLEVTVGDPTEAASNDASLIPLTVSVPKGSPPADYLGWEEEKQGRITLTTNHPKAPRLVIFVRFAVEG